MRKLDQKILKNTILKTRGFLMRKSMKYEQKWTYCFFYIDINKFVAEQVKILKSYRPLKKLIDEEINEIEDLKRVKLS